MNFSFAILVAAVAGFVLVGAVFMVFMRNQNKVVKPRARDENGAPLANDSVRVRRR